MVDGLPGDIVALALPLDIMKIEEAGLINPGWQVRALSLCMQNSLGLCGLR